jgi:hypothetical protein
MVYLIMKTLGIFTNTAQKDKKLFCVLPELEIH